MGCNARKDVFKCRKAGSCDGCMQECAPKLLDACEAFAKGWTHFCKVINFADSTLDADAIRWMNETPPKIGQAIAEAKPS